MNDYLIYIGTTIVFSLLTIFSLFALINSIAKENDENYIKSQILGIVSFIFCSAAIISLIVLIVYPIQALFKTSLDTPTQPEVIEKIEVDNPTYQDIMEELLEIKERLKELK